jgi:hypothetical protein
MKAGKGGVKQHVLGSLRCCFHLFVVREAAARIFKMLFSSLCCEGGGCKAPAQCLHLLTVPSTHRSENPNHEHLKEPFKMALRYMYDFFAQ